MKITCTRPLYNAYDAYSHSISKPQQFVELINLCTTLKQLNKVQAQVTTLGLHRNPFIIGKLVETSAIKLYPHNMNHALLIFTHTQHPNHFTWNTIIRGFSISNTPLHALLIFIRMLRSGDLEPESFTYAFVLKACAQSYAINGGRSVHCHVLKHGHASHVFVATTAIRMYSACTDMTSAQQVFDEMVVRNVVSWNAVIAGYMQNGHPDDGLRAFDQMTMLGVVPNDVTLISVLSACAQKKDLLLGRHIHAYLDGNRVEFESNIKVGTALINMYAKCGCMGSARRVFDEMQTKDVGVWNALIGGYVFNSWFAEALDSFQELQAAGLDPDEPTLASTLVACSHLGALDVGRKIHQYAEEKCFVFNMTLGTALVDMYSKCGCIAMAREVFDEMPTRDATAWTSMIGGLAIHGHAEQALELFSLMRNLGSKPDGITFIGVLSACSHAGLVEQGLTNFHSMINEYNIAPKIEHYGCIIDLLSRVGRLKEAFDFIRSMKIQPNTIIWRSLLSACRLHLNVELAETAVRNLFELESDQCGDYLLLSNIYASKGMWDDAARIKKRMEEEGLRKMPGLSSIETNSKLRTEPKPESRYRQCVSYK